MLRKAYKVLAVAVTTSACTAAVPDASVDEATTKQELVKELSRITVREAVQRAEHFSPLCDGDGYPLPGNINSKESQPTSQVVQLCGAIGKKPVCDKDALNKELSNTLLPDAIAQHDHFRCLCDDKGYPLVGNINAKGATASQFCAELKKDGLL
jgi:hypothetical protein